MSFFESSTNEDKVEEYLKELQESIFLHMELLKQDYISIMAMPVFRFRELISRKIKYDEEVAKLKEEALENLK